MKTKGTPFRSKPVNTLEELRAEKMRLQRRIANTETGIKQDYTALKDALTLRNLLTTIAEDVLATNLVVSQAYGILKPLALKLFKRKGRAVSGKSKKKEISS